MGNRTKATVSQTEATSHYNAFNQLIQQGNIHFEYDANGNLIKRGKRNADNHIAIDPTGTQPYWQYRYDSRERLIEVRKDGNTVARYGYNPMGERTKKELLETGTTIHYLYNEQGLIGEYDDSGRLIQEYGWKPQGLWSTDPLFTRTADNKVHYYLNDQRGQSQRVFTRNGAITWQARSNSYGQTTINDKSTLISNLRLPGQYYDSETGLHYNWFRYYDPSLGSYLRNDPTGLYGGLNAYAYGLSNPLLYADNNGQLPILIPLITNMARFAARKFVGCFVECDVGTGIALTADLVWQHYRGDCPVNVLEASAAALGGCATGCLKPWNWAAGKAKNLGAKLRGGKPKVEAPIVTKRVSSGAENVNAQSALRAKLSGLEKAQQNAATTRQLSDGRVRYYTKEVQARSKGPTRGASFVTEHNPKTGNVRQWMESYDHSGQVNRVHPKSINGQTVNSQHYPPIARELGL